MVPSEIRHRVLLRFGSKADLVILGLVISEPSMPKQTQRFLSIEPHNRSFPPRPNTLPNRAVRANQRCRPEQASWRGQ